MSLCQRRDRQGAFPESVRLLRSETKHSLTVVPLIPASFDCSRGLPNGRATARDALRGLPFGSLGAAAGSSTAIRWPLHHKASRRLKPAAPWLARYSHFIKVPPGVFMLAEGFEGVVQAGFDCAEWDVQNVGDFL